MEVVWLYDERNAIPYVYDSAVPSKISFDHLAFLKDWFRIVRKVIYQNFMY